MAHYAFLNDKNIVVQVIVGKDEHEGNGACNWEKFYENEFGLVCKRTSYNTIAGKHLSGGVAFRGNYAGIGYTYVDELDAFIPPMPFESWVLDESTFQWVAPVPYPDNGKTYTWDEAIKQWDLVVSETVVV